ncbi:MAG: hypothetical protein DI601_11315 [Azospirillum brasilense]|nr:MAG: hypothetical protein DI601_11315 [Azospirillum brasilense]
MDGIRHVSIFENLARVSQPSEAKLLFLSAGNVTRNARVRSRADAEDFTRASAHQVEAELSRALPDLAEEVVDADQPMDRVLADCLDLVRRWRDHR